MDSPTLESHQLFNHQPVKLGQKKIMVAIWPQNIMVAIWPQNIM